jgi:hypothetical protein
MQFSVERQERGELNAKGAKGDPQSTRRRSNSFATSAKTFAPFAFRGFQAAKSAFHAAKADFHSVNSDFHPANLDFRRV